MKAIEFLAYLKKSKLDLVLLIYGEESLLIDETVGALRKKLVDPATSAFNLDIFDGEKADIGRILSAITSWPMIGQHRVVIVRNVEQLNKADRDRLLPYIQKPPSTTYQIYTAAKINGREKFYATAKTIGAEVECKPLYDNQIPQWLQGRFSQIGKQIVSQAGQRLHLSVGNDLYDLANEIEKLDIYTGDRKNITLEDVEFIVGKWRVNTIYDLQRKIGERLPGDAMALMRHLVLNGEAPIKIIVSLMYFFLQLTKVKALLKEQTPRPELAGKIGVNPFFVDDLINQAKRFKEAELERSFSLLYAVDLELKTSAGVPEALMERLVYELCAR